MAKRYSREFRRSTSNRWPTGGRWLARDPDAADGEPLDEDDESGEPPDSDSESGEPEE